jgi:site-specific recombinase XerD
MTEPSSAHALVSLPETPVLPSTHVSRYANNAKATNTRKAYRVDWDAFVLWCDTHGRSPMPATPETLVEYLEGLADTGAKVATIKRRLSSISVAHQMRGHEHDNPTRSGLVTTSMQGIRRTLGTAQTQKTPLVTAELARLVAACEQLSQPLAAARDRALVLIGCSGGFRRSELVALNVADITETANGLELTLHHSKTDQEGAGAVVAVPYGSHPHTCPVRSLHAWLGLSGISEGPIWREIDRHGTLGAGRLHADSVARIIKRACTLAGLDPAGYSGHSLRSGMATAAAAGGAPERAIMRQGRWTSRAMVDRYVRHGTLWQECAAAYMGL